MLITLYKIGEEYFHLLGANGQGMEDLLRTIRLDELSSVMRLERRTTEDSSSRRIMRLVPVFTLETNNQTHNECLLKFVQTDNASSSIKTVIGYLGLGCRHVFHS